MMNVSLANRSTGNIAVPQVVEQEFPCSIFGAGLEVQDSVNYVWHGLKRGPLWLANFQYTIEGCGVLDYEGKRFEIPAGHAMLIHFPHNHCYRFPDGGAPWKFFWVTLLGSHTEATWDSLEKSAGPVVKIADHSSVLKTFQNIHEDLIEQSNFSPFRASALGYQFLMDVTEELLFPSVEATEHPSIQKVIQFCESQFQNAAIGVEDLAEHSGMSRYHFTRVFQKVTGESPGNFLRSLRMKNGARLLRTQEHSVKEVSTFCGYEDVNNFCRAFKKSYGVSPGVFKNSGL